MTRLPLTDAEVHSIAEAVMAQLMPRVELALEHAYTAGRKAALADLREQVRMTGGGNVQAALGGEVRP